MKLESSNSQDAPRSLVAWYQKAKRSLPWRETTDPYKIWVSEVMLQQTRVETVIPYYYAFLDQYPTVRDLALAEEAEVLKLWQGLGYYSRARNLHQAARDVLRRFNGVIPEDEKAFSSLKGVGPYTLGAVQSIAFNHPVPAIDGNVLRVMSRFLEITTEVRQPESVKTITGAVSQWLQQESPRLLTQALMELGALVCKPQHPLCQECPLSETCKAFRADLTTSIPVRKKPPRRKQVQVVALWCQQGHRILLERRPGTGLLADMWQLPAVEFEAPLSPLHIEEGRELEVPDLIQREGEKLLSGLLYPQGFADSGKVAEAGVWSFRTVAKLQHQFTHIDWLITVLQPVGYSFHTIVETDTRQWANEERLQELAVPRVYDKLFTEFYRRLNHSGVFFSEL